MLNTHPPAQHNLGPGRGPACQRSPLLRLVILLGLTLSGGRGQSAENTGTQLQSNGNTLFQADAAVTFAATYGAVAIRTTITSPAETQVLLHVGKRPKNVFSNLERLGTDVWEYDAETACVRLSVGDGATEVQVRFDDVTSIKPFDVDIPVVLCDATWRPLGPKATIKARCARDLCSGSGEWQGDSGIYRGRPRQAGKPVTAGGLRLTGSGALNLGGGEVEALVLSRGGPIRIEADSAGARLPLDTIEVQQVSRVAALELVAEIDLDAAGNVLVEGEAFSAEGGGKVLTSTEHKNTHAGGCVYSWASAGHWIAWRIKAPNTGQYLLTIVAATAEQTALRSLRLDGRPLPEAGLIAFTHTGPGWGRSDPKEWQAFRPVDDQGTALRVSLSKGEHELRLENLLGQHLNIDCILLTPAP